MVARKKLKNKGEDFDFIFLEWFFLEGKSISLLKFCCCLGVFEAMFKVKS
jgi:hypothetical protein